MDLNKIRDLATEILAELGVVSSDTPPVVNKEPLPVAEGYPKLVAINGAAYMLKAPINPTWKGSPTDWVFGNQEKTFVFDPSNADDNHPLRSPAGYPLHYASEANGLNSDRIPPRVKYDGQTFANDAEIDDPVNGYKVRVIQRDANLDEAGGNFSPYNPDGTPRT